MEKGKSLAGPITLYLIVQLTVMGLCVWKCSKMGLLDFD